jgi:hypothetical protein
MKTGFLSEKNGFSVSSADQDNSLCPNGSRPGQKSIRPAQKGANSSFPDAGFRRFGLGIPLPPRLFAERQKGE